VRDFVSTTRPQIDFLNLKQIFCQKARSAACLFDLCEAIFQPPETLRPLRGQPVAVLVQVHQRESRAQPLEFLVELGAWRKDKGCSTRSVGERPSGVKTPSDIGAFAARLNRLRKNSLEAGTVTGHDFSRAAKANRINAGFSPCYLHSANSAPTFEFFRSL